MAECHPVGFQWVDRGQARAAPRSSTSTRGSPGPARWRTCTCRTGPAVTSCSSARWSTTCCPAGTTSASTSPRTPTPPTSCREDFTSTPRTSTGCSPGYDPATRSYDNATWQPTGERDLTLHPPALRLPGAEAPLRPLHAGAGRSRPAGSPRRTSAGSPPRWSRAAAGSARRRGSTRSAGPSTPPACSTSAPPRSCSCCSATWAGRAAASWRCAGTPASRAPPTSRPCSTCCPATCRCRGRTTSAWSTT